MEKQKKIMNSLLTAVLVILIILIAVAAILVFPLKGAKHIEIWGADKEFNIADVRTVEKKNDEFRILIFADPQLWTDQIQNGKCYAETDALVERTKPDMIVTVGDNLSAFENRFTVGRFTRKMESYGVPWAPVFGNHDGETPGTSLNWVADQMMKGEKCLFQKGPSNLYGCGNYVINITENGVPVYSLFMFDNGRYIQYDEETTREIYMGYEQIAWYEWNVRGIEKAAGGIVPSMTFSHFAQPEFREAVEKLAIKDENGVYTIPKELGFGKCDYLPSAPLINSGFVKKCKELGSTKYIFCGHDHENSASLTYDGITYTYGLKTGPSPVPWNAATETGGTLVSLDAQNNARIEHIVITQK